MMMSVIRHQVYFSEPSQDQDLKIPYLLIMLRLFSKHNYHFVYDILYSQKIKEGLFHFRENCLSYNF